MSGLCKDCQHWKKHIFQDVHFCTLTASHENEPSTSPSLAIARSSGGGTGWLNTTPDFGCNQYEPKEDE